MKRRLKGAPARIRAKVGADRSWEETVRSFSDKLPKHLGKCKSAEIRSQQTYVTDLQCIFTDAPVRVTFAKADAGRRPKKRKPVYCLCKGEERIPMVQCGSCSEWYHFDCLEKAGTRLPLDRSGTLPRMFKFECAVCKLRQGRLI
jgi:hypothetical protein